MTLPAESKLTLLELLKHVFYVLQIGSRHFGEVTQVAFPLGGLLGQDVTLVRVLPFDLAGAGFCKPFLGSGL
jgi:hypothetical protein